MIVGRTILRALLDAGVPDSVGGVLQAAGHHVTYHRAVLPERTPDLVVAATALANGAILVAIDRDMRQIARRYDTAARDDRFNRLHLILIGCNEALAAKRLEQALTFVENEWIVCEMIASRRLWLEIGPHHLRTNR